MANKSDILLRYKNAYSEYEAKTKGRLEDLKRSFSDEKEKYVNDIKALDNQLHLQQSDIYNQMIELHEDYQSHKADIHNHFEQLKNEFNEEFYQQMSQLDQQIIDEANTYDDILEEFELRKQDALDLYLKLTKDNNDAIDKEMQIHRDYILSEQKKLLEYKTAYDELSAELSNKMMWTLEKSKNAIEMLHNRLDDLNKDDLISLNQQILKALTDLRGTRNEINVIFKDTSNRLNNYKDEIYKLRKDKQKPYSSINHQLIQKLIKQIRIANRNKVKYQAIIRQDLKESLKQLYPSIIKAHNENNNDDLEKYILQTEILQEKADFLNKKIEKITNYNISTYQKRIKDIKIETFTRNEEIKFSYSVPMKFIENAINIYSNYNFYFNQGFNDLDTLLSDMITFSQNFNELRNKESLMVKEDLTAYQNNYLAKISDVSKQLSSLLYHIDEVAVQISTLESQNRLEIAEIKKEMVNVDIKGDYKKYLETLETDFQIANKEYKNRLKTINIKKMYHDQTLELYQSAIHLDQEKEALILNTSYQQSLTDIETSTHLSHYDYLKAHYNIFYKHQENMLNDFMKIIKERLTQSLKASNYQLAKGYFEHEASLNFDTEMYKETYINLKKRLLKALKINEKETASFINYLSKKGKEKSTINHLEKLRLQLNHQITQNHKQKTKAISQTIIDTYEDIHQVKDDMIRQMNKVKKDKKKLLFLIEKDMSKTPTAIKNLEGYHHMLYTITTIYYQVNALNYKHHVIDRQESLNDYYDDTIFSIIEDAVRLQDKVANTSKINKQFKLVKKYLIKQIKVLQKTERFFEDIIDHTQEQYLHPYITQLAMIEIDINHQKTLVQDYFDSFGKQSLKHHRRIEQQQSVIKDMSAQFKQWIDKQIKMNYDRLINKVLKHDDEMGYVKKHISKIVKRNDKQLKKINKEVNRLFTNQYLAMMKDYQFEMNLIDDLKDKLHIDQDVEKQYIDYTSKQARTQISETKDLLYRKINAIPSERHGRLHEVNQSRHQIFNEHQAVLHDQLHEIEKEKFTSVPLLEKKIERLEKQVKSKFEQLYNKHQSLEEHYLNEYINTNEQFVSLHQGFQKDLIDSKLRYDDELDQPLKDLLNTETSVINIVDTIHQEVSSKTNQKIKEIHANKKASQNKQDRIINS